MLNSAFTLGEEMTLRNVCYNLYPPLWVKYRLPEIDLDISNWQTIKYLNDDATELHHDLSKVPNNKGGLYLFSIRCNILPGISSYPVYVGRAQLTKGQNLRKRTREYFTKFAREDERPLITKMIKYWGKELHLSFIEVEDNNEIIDFEKKLINSLLLPFNNQIPDVEIRQGINAFP
jgi:excinuclease UvrABC nuclease subunit